MAVEAENVPFKENHWQAPHAPKFIPGDLQTFLVVAVVGVFPGP